MTKSYVAPVVWQSLPGAAHWQTILPATISRDQALVYSHRERCLLSDGDFVDLDWLSIEPDHAFCAQSSVEHFVVFHGLEGSSQSHYVRSLGSLLRASGKRCTMVAVNFRGCSGEPNWGPRAYHSGDSEEIEQILTQLIQGPRKILLSSGQIERRLPVENARWFAYGVSLGGNALAKWLGESGEKAGRLIHGAVIANAPMDLAVCAQALMRPVNQIYLRHFLASLLPKAEYLAHRFPGLLDDKALRRVNDFHTFDTVVTAPLHGFRDCWDYWARSSCRQFLHGIGIPTLFINARNDPFVPESVLPIDSMVSKWVLLEQSKEGGHVGYPNLWGRGDWLAQRTVDFFRSSLA